MMNTVSLCSHKGDFSFSVYIMLTRFGPSARCITTETSAYQFLCICSRNTISLEYIFTALILFSLLLVCSIQVL
jgi:hypothetical protein